MKRVRDTSAAVFYEAIQPSLSTREQIVYTALQSFCEPPTSYELTDYLIARRLVSDLNGCRPRLTELLAKGHVALGPKRKCRVTNITVYTWRIARPLPAREPEPQRLNF